MKALPYKKIIFTPYVATLSCVLLTLISYFFWDRAIADWVHAQQLQQYPIFQLFCDLPNVLAYSFASLAFVVILRYRLAQLKKSFSKMLIAIPISCVYTLIITRLCKVFFGRTGPSYWLEHPQDPSVFHFHFLKGTTHLWQYFPSGHSSLTFAMLAVIVCAYPKLRYYCLLLGITVMLSLIANQYHFLSDCIAGALLGSMIGYYCARFFGLTERNSSPGS